MIAPQILSTWLKKNLMNYDVSPKANQNSPQNILDITKNVNRVHFSTVLWQRNSKYISVFGSSFHMKKTKKPNKVTTNPPVTEE